MKQELRNLVNSLENSFLVIDRFLVRVGNAEETTAQAAARHYLENVSIAPPSQPEPIIKWQSLKKYASTFVI